MREKRKLKREASKWSCCQQISFFFVHLKENKHFWGIKLKSRAQFWELLFKIGDLNRHHIWSVCGESLGESINSIFQFILLSATEWQYTQPYAACVHTLNDKFLDFIHKNIHIIWYSLPSTLDILIFNASKWIKLFGYFQICEMENICLISFVWILCQEFFKSSICDVLNEMYANRCVVFPYKKYHFSVDVIY